MPVAALVTDLLFATKIRSTAQSLGVPVRVVRTATDLLSAASESDLLLIDANSEGSDLVEVIRQIRQLPHPPKTLVFLSHVQKELADSARQAGADEVMPRSRFSSDLPAILERARRE